VQFLNLNLHVTFHYNNNNVDEVNNVTATANPTIANAIASTIITTITLNK
jgi:hypothetical protein